jgi:hypothetical protein
MDMEKKRYDFMKKKADDAERELASLPDQPKRKPLPKQAPLFTASNMTKEEQMAKDKQSRFVVEAVESAKSKAIAKEKNQKFLAKTTNTAEGPSEAEMVKEATGKAEKRAISGLDMQKNEVKEAVKMSNKYLEKSSMSKGVAAVLKTILDNATSYLENSEEVDVLHAIVKLADKKMLRAVEKHDARIKKHEEAKANKKEAKEKKKENDDVLDARRTWVESRLVGFTSGDAEKFTDRIHTLSKRIETATPSVERLKSLNEDVHEMYQSVRKAEYEEQQRTKLTNSLKLLKDDPKAMMEYNKKFEEGRTDRKYRRYTKNAKMDFADTNAVATVKTSEAQAKVDFKHSETKLEKRAEKEKGVEIENRKLHNGVSKLKEKVKALEAAAKTAAPAITTELVKPDGEVVKEIPPK